MGLSESVNLTAEWTDLGMNVGKVVFSLFTYVIVLVNMRMGKGHLPGLGLYRLASHGSLSSSTLLSRLFVIMLEMNRVSTRPKDAGLYGSVGSGQWSVLSP